MNDCLFCKIVAKEIPAEVIYEDDAVLAILDITPVNPGHVLVLPKKHVRNIFDIEPGDWGAVMERVRLLSPAVRDATAAEGINIHVNNEPAAGQIIFHSHVHIIPRYENDGREHWHGKKAATEELRAMREKILASI
jgi:histidine triad (HIT) family protein